MTETYTFPRDGQRPLRFRGELRAESYGTDYRRDPTRWYALGVYRAASGKTVVYWQYFSKWQGEVEHRRAEDFATEHAAADALETFDPCAWVIAYKPLLQRGSASAEHYVSRQAEVERQIRTAYAAQVRDLCAALDIVEDL